MKLPSIAVCVATLLAPTFTSATQLLWDEQSQGDIPQDDLIFRLGAGANAIQGSLLYSQSPTGDLSIDFDDFAFVVPEGYQLTSIQFEYTLTSQAGSIRDISILLQLYSGNPKTIDNVVALWPGWQPIYGAATLPSSSALPLYLPGPAGSISDLPAGALDTGLYWTALGRLTGMNYGSSAAYEYKWTLNVQQEPNSVAEPSPLFLVLAAFIAAFALGKRVRHAESELRLRCRSEA